MTTLYYIVTGIIWNHHTAVPEHVLGNIPLSAQIADTYICIIFEHCDHINRIYIIYINNTCLVIPAGDL